MPSSSRRCRRGRTRSRRGRRGHTCGGITPSTPSVGRASVGPRTCRRAIRGSPRWCPDPLPTSRRRSPTSVNQLPRSRTSSTTNSPAARDSARIRTRSRIPARARHLDTGCDRRLQPRVGVPVAGGRRRRSARRRRSGRRPRRRRARPRLVLGRARGGRCGLYRRAGAALQRGEPGQPPRRVLVASYAPTAENYTRAHYYAQRRDRMRTETERDGRFRISTLADFDGAEVATEAAVDHCTHP